MSWHKFYNNCMDVNNQLIRIQEKLEKLKSSIKVFIVLILVQF